MSLRRATRVFAELAASLPLDRSAWWSWDGSQVKSAEELAAAAGIPLLEAKVRWITVRSPEGAARYGAGIGLQVQLGNGKPYPIRKAPGVHVPEPKPAAPKKQVPPAPKAPKPAKSVSRVSPAFTRKIDKHNPDKTGLDDLIADVHLAETQGDASVMSSGKVGFTEKVRLPDGRSLFRKQNASWNARDAKTITDAETLAALVGQAIGAPVPRVVRTSDDTIYTDWVDGREGQAFFKSRVYAEMEGYPDTPELQAKVESQAGSRLGLLDLLMGNGDRHNSNWMVTKEGTVVGIDHGNGWWATEATLAANTEEEFWAAMVEDISGPFVQRWFDWAHAEDVGDLVTVDTLAWTRADVRKVRTRLKKLRPAFVKAGRGTWLDFSLKMLDTLEPYAKGTRSIFDD